MYIQLTPMQEQLLRTADVADDVGALRVAALDAIAHAREAELVGLPGRLADILALIDTMQLQLSSGALAKDIAAGRQLRQRLANR